MLFLPGDLDGEGEGDGRGVESVSSCSISFSNFIKPGGSTPNLLKAQFYQCLQTVHVSIYCIEVIMSKQ